MLVEIVVEATVVVEETWTFEVPDDYEDAAALLGEDEDERNFAAWDVIDSSGRVRHLDTMEVDSLDRTVVKVRAVPFVRDENTTG